LASLSRLLDIDDRSMFHIVTVVSSEDMIDSPSALYEIELM